MRGIRFYLFGHLDQWYEWFNWYETKKTICSGRWFVGSGIIAGFFQTLGSLRLFFFHCFYQLCLYFPKSIVDGIPTQRQVKWEKSETYNYEIEETSISRKWQWKWKWKVKVDESVGLSNFDFRCLKFGFYLFNQFRFHSDRFSYTWPKSDENISEGNIFFYSLFIFNVRYLE